MATNPIHPAARQACAAGLLWLAAGLPAHADVTITGRAAPEAGERCIVCDAPLGPDDSVLIVKGRRVPVSAEMESEFLADPERYFAALQPRGALFTEDLTSRPMRPSWFGIGLWALTSLVSGGASAYLAISRGQAPARWFAVGLVGNVPGLTALALLGGRGDTSRVPTGLAKVPATAPPRACGSCGQAVHPDASSCASCGAGLEPSQPSEARRVLGGSR